MQGCEGLSEKPAEQYQRCGVPLQLQAGLKAPVLFLIFNRPEPARRVLEAIRRARPVRLYVAADGPRAHVPSDAAGCAETRKILQQVDWDCQVKTLFREQNLGCRRAVSSAITWFFEQEERGIILEDDCLPEPSFFPFCEELLERYQDDERVMHISGNNFQFGAWRGDGSYYFSIYNHIWGWASWRRAWRQYDIDMRRLPVYLNQGRIAEVLQREDGRNYWLHHFVKTYNGEIDTWDYQWTFATWERGGLSILPNVNLVTNIGFGPDAVHCQNADSPLASMPCHPIGELRHPSSVIPNREADDFTTDCIFLGKITPAQAVQAQRRAVAPPGDPLQGTKETEPMVSERMQRSVQQNPKQAFDSASSLKEQAMALLQRNCVKEAFQLLIRAKALKTPLVGLDLLRAHCFTAMGQPMAAKQALLEELRLFPCNSSAQQMLAYFEASSGSPTDHLAFDPEFQQLLMLIRPYSMLGELRLYSLFQLAKYICENDIPGNFVECGVAAGGSSALLAYVIKAYSKRPRTLYSFDSFSGMPTPGEHDVEVGRGMGAEETGWGTGTCAAPVDSLLQIAQKLGVISIVKPVKGYYEDTLPRIHDFVGGVAFIHIDSDWYESTRTILQNFYDQIHPRAMIQFDDYGYWKGCGKALHEFEKERGISFSINNIDGNGVWFTKP